MGNKTGLSKPLILGKFACNGNVQMAFQLLTKSTFLFCSNPKLFALNKGF